MTLFSRLKAGERVTVTTRESGPIDIEWRDGCFLIYKSGTIGRMTSETAVSTPMTKDELHVHLNEFQVVEAPKTTKTKPKRKKK